MKRFFLRSKRATNISERRMVSARLASMVKLNLMSARLRHFGVAELHNRDPSLIDGPRFVAVGELDAGLPSLSGNRRKVGGEIDIPLSSAPNK